MTAETSNARGEWVLVPRNPTEAMIDAWRDAPDIWEDAYAAMLAAAPQPPSAPVGVEGLIEAAKAAESMLRTVHECASHECEDCREYAGIVAKQLRAALAQKPEARGGGEVAAWETEDGRVISARQKATALRDGGASASSVAPYTTPLYRTAPPSVPVGVEEVVMAARNAENTIRNCAAAGQIGDGYVQYADDLRDAVQRLAQQPAARPPKPTECMNGCPDRQVCDHCQWPPGPDQQPAAVDEAYPTPRNRAEAVALARLALAHLGVIDAHIDAAIARCETNSATQRQEPKS